MGLLQKKHQQNKQMNTRPLPRPRNGVHHAENSYEMTLCDCGRFVYGHEKRGECRNCGADMCADCYTEHRNVCCG